MKPVDERQARISELRLLKVSDFALRDKLSFCQEDVEIWGEIMGDFSSDSGKINLARIRRLAFQAAYQGKWFEGAPELAEGDFVLMPPGLVSAVGNAVLDLYNEINVPDMDFTSASQTP